MARTNPNFTHKAHSNDLENPSRSRLETLSCPKLFPIEETSKLNFPVGTYRQTSKSARNSPVSLRPELLAPSSSRSGISNLPRDSKLKLKGIMLVTFPEKTIDNKLCCSYNKDWTVVAWIGRTPVWILYRNISKYYFICVIISNNFPFVEDWNRMKVECDHYTAVSTAPFMVYPPKFWFFKIIVRLLSFQVTPDAPMVHNNLY